MSDNLGRPFFVLLASIALAADLVTLGQFIISGTVLKFWSTQWIIGFIFIIALLIVGFGLFILGHEEEKAKQVMPVFGGIYIVMGDDYVFIFWIYASSRRDIDCKFYWIYCLIYCYAYNLIVLYKNF